MFDHPRLSALLLGLLATLLVAAFGFYQWRRRSVGPGRSPRIESRQKAGEALWASLEDANFRMRDTADSSRQSAVARLRDVNAHFVKHSRHLDDPGRVTVKAYLGSLHRVATLLSECDPPAAVDWIDTAILPIAGGDARLVDALQELARQREIVRQVLLRASGC